MSEKKIFKNDYYIGCDNINEICEEIQLLFNRQEVANHKLRKELKELKDEKWKDNELQKIEDELKKMQNEIKYSFMINESEWKSVIEWQEKHDAEKHHLTNANLRMKASGVCGGRYSFHFIPTSIGIIGYCKCGSCGEEFKFQDLG